MDTAHLLGLRDRGVLAPGLRADINVIDLEHLTLHPPFMAHDLPNNAARWMQLADGYRMTVVAGVPTWENGVSTGALPGGLVRSPLRPYLSVRTLEQIDPAEIAGPEPKSTPDTMVDAENLVGGASAIAAAQRTNQAMRKATGISAFGDFLSGKMLRKESSDPFGRLRGDESVASNPTGGAKL
jgi:hypothetical protein